MRKILIIVFLVCSYSCFAQPSNYNQIPSRNHYIALSANAFNAPSGQTVGFQTGQWPKAGSLYTDTLGTDSGFYYSGRNQVWHRLAKYSDITGINQKFGDGDARSSGDRYFSLRNSDDLWIDSAAFF